MIKFSFSLKNLQNTLKPLVTLLCVVSLVFLTQACSGAKTVANPGGSDYQSREQLGANGYDVKNSYEGGMNGFVDTHPKADYNQKAVNKKADYLIKNAERNFDNGQTVFDNIGNALSNNNAKDVAKNTGRVASDIGNKVENTAENVAKGTERGLENIKDNVENAPGYFSKTARQTTNN